MKEKLTHNLGWKLISLGLAFLVWLVVLGIEDPVYTREITDIAITQINGDSITDAGMAYSFPSGNTVTVKVTGKTSIIGKLTRDDFLAVADLSKLSITGAVTVDVTCPGYQALDITPVGSSNVLLVEIEELVEKSLNVQIETVGSAGQGYYVGQGSAAPNMVTVSGPASLVARVSQARVTVSISEENTSDILTTSTVVLLDQNGTAISGANLNLSKSDISVTIPIYPVKTVAVEMNISGEAANGYIITDSAYEPREITVAGRAEALEGITSITLDDYDISNISENLEDSILLDEHLASALPEGIILTDKDVQVAVAVSVEKIEEKELEIPIKSISLTGTDDNLHYTKYDNEENLKVVITGPASQIEKLTADSLELVADVSDYGFGTNHVPVTIKGSELLTIKNDVTISVLIEE